MNKRFIIYLFTILLLVFSVVPSAFSAPLVNPSNNIVVYIVPHADDEVLSYGVPILNDIRAGKKVYLVLISPGETSKARLVVNGQTDAGTSVFCKWHQKYHNSAAEQHADNYLTKEIFGQARIKEFFKAGQELGVPKTQLKSSIIPNDQFNYQSVRSIVLSYVRLFPNAHFKGFSSVDYHPDHATIGKVLNDLHQQNYIKNSKTNILSILTDRHIHTTYPLHVPGYKLYLTNSNDKTKLSNAISRVYAAWDPENGIYGLGYHSVPDQFHSLLKDPYTKITSY